MNLKSGMEFGKDCKQIENGDPETLKIMVFLKMVAKNATPTLLQKTLQTKSSFFKMAKKSVKYRSGRKDEKTTKKNTKKHQNCTKKHPPRVSHERGPSG